MQITFHGAAGCVTGSKHLITLQNGDSILLDCGLFQGMGEATFNLNANFGFDAKTITAVVLSHAHIDHTGLLPKLIKEGFTGKIYCTPATKDLANILLQDSANIQEMDVKFANKRRAFYKLPLYQPLYTQQDATDTATHFVTHNYDTPFAVTESVQCTFTDTGHIVGSAAINLTIADGDVTKQLTFSGDVGRYTDAILKSPQPFAQANYIIMESTYGDTLHDQHTDTPDTLLQWINNICIAKKGKLLIPAFSVGRTQELLYALNTLENQGKLPKLSYIVDSPLSEDATTVLKAYPQYFNNTIQQVIQQGDKDPFMFAGLQYTQTVEDSKMLNYNNEPCVIISSSGMADAGRIKHHISNNIENSNNGILMSGYCEPNSLGGRLKTKPDSVTIFGQSHQVNAQIGELRSMSAHGDYNDLCNWLSCQNAAAVEHLFLVHGEPKVQQHLQQTLIGKGFKNITIPTLHQRVII